MMRPAVLIALGFALAAASAVISGRRLHAARHDLERARAQLQSTVTQIERIHELRTQRQQVEAGEKPPQALIAQVNAILTELGLPHAALGEVAPQGDEPLRADAASPYRVQSVRITLRGLAVHDLARFIQRWNERHPIWRPAQIQLTHARAGDAEENTYDLMLLLRAMYVDENQNPRQGPEAQLRGPGGAGPEV